MTIRDSITKCDSSQYSNPYQVTNHPAYKADSSTNSRPVHKDTLEVFQDELKKDALERLRQTKKLIIPQRSYMKIGKYVFLAIALPPYTVIYRIPKWLIVQLIPQIMKTTVFYKQKIKQKFQKRLETVVVKFNKIMKQIQGTLNGLIQPVVQAALFVRNGLQRVQQMMSAFANKTAAKIKQPMTVKRVKENLKNLFDKIREKASEAREWAANRVSTALTNTFVNPLQAGLGWIKQAPQITIQKGTQYIESKRQKLINNFRNSKQMAQQATKWITHHLDRYKQDLKWAGKQIQSLYKEVVQPTLQQMRSVIKGQMDRLNQFLKQQNKQFQNSLNRLKANWQKWTDSDQLSQFFNQSQFSWTPSFARQYVQKFFRHKKVQTGIKWFFKILSFLGYGLQQVLTWLFKMFKLVKQAVSMGYHLIRENGKMILSVLGSTLKAVMSFIGHLIGRAFYHTLVIIFMLGILLVWSFQWLGELTYFGPTKSKA